MEERKLSVADCVSDFPRLIMLPEPPLITDPLPAEPLITDPAPPPPPPSCDISSFDDWGGCFLDDDFLELRLLDEPIICDTVIGRYLFASLVSYWHFILYAEIYDILRYEWESASEEDSWGR